MAYSHYTVEACYETECFVEPEFDCVELTDFLVRERELQSASLLRDVLLDGGCHAAGF